MAALLATVTLISAMALVQPSDRTAHNVLYQGGVALNSNGKMTIVEAGADPNFLPGTRVIDPGPDETQEAAEKLAEESRQWLASGDIPQEYPEMATTALLDLHTMTVSSGGVIAGPSAAWRYVWPRDASFVAAAYAATGHLEDAVGVLDFLQQVQAPDGSFHARYLPDGSGVPDNRGLQTDGTAWTLWSLQRVLTAAETAQATGSPGAAAQETHTSTTTSAEQGGSAVSGSAGYRPAQLRERFEPLLNRSVNYLMSQTSTPDHLPLPSADYWERPESRVTLGTAAPVLAGLESAEQIYRQARRDDGAARLGERTDELRSAIVAAFGSSGYGRYPGRTARDSAVAFTLAPFLTDPLPGALSAWQDSIPAMQRPGGGLAPGEAWAETSMSWTPETALYAWAAAANDRPERARALLDWIESHRTSIGAIPEKVGPDGSPAHVAPLAWSDALVLLTLTELESTGEQSAG